MPRYDRDELLARLDLEQLFAETVGPAQGHGRSAQWPCPNPEHTQTGASPPVSIDNARGVWNCFGCNASGTAIDVVMMRETVGVAEAIERLAGRVGLRADTPPPRPVNRRPAARRQPAPASADPVDLETYVGACEQLLWSDAGADVLAYLRGRGLDDDTLQENRVGADPGPRQLPRADGLPKRGAAVVFPILEPSGRPAYCQVRYLEDGQRRYDNPLERVWGPSPRVAVVRTAGADDPGSVLVCEGMPDALTIAGVGYRAAAVLGAAQPDEDVARRLVAAFPNEDLVIAFDADERGRAGAAQLGKLLAAAGAGPRVWSLPVPDAAGDLNAWAQSAGDAFTGELEQAWQDVEPLGWEPMASAADLLADLVAELANPAGAVAITTGLAQLDEYFARGGWRPGVVLLGGLAGIGKSAFALQAAVIAAAAGHPVLYVSVEQAPLELVGRLFCKETGHPISDYWNREPAFLADVRLTAPTLPLANLYVRADPHLYGVDDAGTVGRIRKWATALADQRGTPPLVVVDYLQRMRPPEADRRLDDHRQISMAGLGLRQLARDLGCPVLAISSISRAGYDKPPSLDAFKGSGDLEYDADACLLLRIDAATGEEARRIADEHAAQIPVNLFVVKNRYGALTPDEAPIRLSFDRRFGGFRPRPTGSARYLPPPPPPGLRQAELEPPAA